MQVSTLLGHSGASGGGGGGGGGGGPTVTFADIETKKRERKTGDRMETFQESEENMHPDLECEFAPIRKSDSLDNCSDVANPKNDLSPMLSEPIDITLSPSDSQKNLSRSFEESRPRSLEMETEKESINSKGLTINIIYLASLTNKDKIDRIFFKAFCLSGCCCLLL